MGISDELGADRTEGVIKSLLYIRGTSGIGEKTGKETHEGLAEDGNLSFLFRLSPCKDVEMGQPSYALQPGRVDEPSGLPLILGPLTSHEPVHTRASTLDEFLVFWGSLHSIYGIIRRDAPLCEGGKRRGKRGGGWRGRSQTGESPQTIGFYTLRYSGLDNRRVEDGLTGPDDAVFDLGRNCVRNISGGFTGETNHSCLSKASHSRLR